MDREPKPEKRMSPEASRSLASFRMEEVDRKLQTASRLLIQPKAVIDPVIPVDQPRPTTTSKITTLSSPSSSLDESSSSISSSNEMGPIRSLDECIDIFKNVPRRARPLSDNLALLNDEEIILMSQNGKVATYALEKVLRPAELERAVRIGRALIFDLTYSNFGNLRYPIN